MIWKGLVLVTGSPSPIVVVLSGSMEPGMARGDILFLNQPKDSLHCGDIVVYNVDDREIPIVHRIVKMHHRAGNGDHDGVKSSASPTHFLGSRKNATHVDILTKGDNNYGDDRGLYPRGVEWLNTGHVMGKVVGFLPHVGRATIVMNDYPVVKFALIAVLAVVVLTSKE